MKKLLLIVLLIPLGLFAQKKEKNQIIILPETDGKIYYSEVIQLDSSYSKNDLYVNSKKFFVDIFNSGKDVIQMDDKDNGIMIGKGFFTAPWHMGGLVSYNVEIWHTIKIYIKDGKYKYEITDFKYKFFGRTSGWDGEADWHEGTLESFDKKNSDKTLLSVSYSVNSEIELLKKYMSEKQTSNDF